MEQVYLTVSSKGQIVIPAAFRAELGIEVGTRIAARLDGGRLVLDIESLTAKLLRVEQMCGITAGGRSGTEILLEDRRLERECELREEGW